MRQKSYVSPILFLSLFSKKRDNKTGKGGSTNAS